MNSKEIIGMKIIDKNAKDVAKITEFNFNIKTYKISNIIASIGNPISKKFYEIDPETILALGDYMLIDTTVEEIAENKLDKIPASGENNMKINESIGKTVLDSEGNVAGKISNIDIDFDTFEIKGLTISKASSFGKPKETNNISKEDIISFGDYILINKKFEKPSQKKEDTTEEASKESSQEKETKNMKIDIE